MWKFKRTNDDKRHLQWRGKCLCGWTGRNHSCHSLAFPNHCINPYIHRTCHLCIRLVHLNVSHFFILISSLQPSANAHYLNIRKRKKNQMLNFVTKQRRRKRTFSSILISFSFFPFFSSQFHLEQKDSSSANPTPMVSVGLTKWCQPRFFLKKIHKC